MHCHRKTHVCWSENKAPSAILPAHREVLSLSSFRCRSTSASSLLPLSRCLVKTVRHKQKKATGVTVKEWGKLQKWWEAVAQFFFFSLSLPHFFLTSSAWGEETKWGGEKKQTLKAIWGSFNGSGDKPIGAGIHPEQFKLYWFLTQCLNLPLMKNWNLVQMKWLW